MQTAVPKALDPTAETPETQRLYGIDGPATAVYGRRLLAARRLAERGVRYDARPDRGTDAALKPAAQ